MFTLVLILFSCDPDTGKCHTREEREARFDTRQACQEAGLFYSAELDDVRAWRCFEELH